MLHVSLLHIAIILYQCHSFSTRTYTSILQSKKEYPQSNYNTFIQPNQNDRIQIDKSIIPLKNSNNEYTNDDNLVRLNKVLKETHSRREADALIKSGRITINGKSIDARGDGMGVRVIPFVDTVELDGVTITGWEQMNGFFPPPQKKQQHQHQHQHQHQLSKTKKNFFEYIKYWKPKGVTCTTEKSVKSNIIDTLKKRHGYNPKHRVYPVGRLDKDTTGKLLHHKQTKNIMIWKYVYI